MLLTPVYKFIDIGETGLYEIILFRKPAKPSKRSPDMARPKGTFNAATMAKKAAEKARIIAEYEASRQAIEAPLANPQTVQITGQVLPVDQASVVPKEVADVIEEHESLDLGESTDAAKTGEVALPEEPDTVLESSGEIDDSLLDLEPPVNPIKAKKEALKSRQEQPSKKRVDKRPPVKVASSASVPVKRAVKAAAAPVSHRPHWMSGTKGW